MYLVRENIIDGKVDGYWVDEKIRGILIESIFVRLEPKLSCSCRYFAESKNPHNHFHIELVKRWVESGKPVAAIYAKTKQGKISTLCPGFIKS